MKFVLTKKCCQYIYICHEETIPIQINNTHKENGDAQMGNRVALLAYFSDRKKIKSIRKEDRSEI